MTTKNYVVKPGQAARFIYEVVINVAPGLFLESENKEIKHRKEIALCFTLSQTQE